MIHHGKDAVEKKIRWNYADMIKGPEPELESRIRVSLDKINLVLLSNSKEPSERYKPGFPFLKLVSSNIEACIQVFEGQVLHKQFEINNLSIENCGESE